MSELDIAKENIAYLKVWLGILVVTDISMAGWLISNGDTASRVLLAGGLVDVAALSVVTEALKMDIILAVLVVAMAFLFVGIALHAARDPKERR
jgi:hypothetical protein